MTQYFTKEGLKKLKEELNEFKDSGDHKKSYKTYCKARAFGHLKENQAYHDATDAKVFSI